MSHDVWDQCYDVYFMDKETEVQTGWKSNYRGSKSQRYDESI